MSAVTCARCGKRLTGGRWVFSPATGNRYCIDIDACGRRAKKKPKTATP